MVDSFNVDLLKLQIENVHVTAFIKSMNVM